MGWLLVYELVGLFTLGALALTDLDRPMLAWLLGGMLWPAVWIQTLVRQLGPR